MQTNFHHRLDFKNFKENFQIENPRKVQFHWNFVNPAKEKALKEINDAINHLKIFGTIDC